jgi:hypothetical protein
MKLKPKLAMIPARHQKLRDGQARELSATLVPVDLLRRFPGRQSEDGMPGVILQEMCSNIAPRMEDIQVRRQAMGGDYAEFASQSLLLHETGVLRFNPPGLLSEYLHRGSL